MPRHILHFEDLELLLIHLRLLGLAWRQELHFLPEEAAFFGLLLLLLLLLLHLHVLQAPELNILYDLRPQLLNATKRLQKRPSSGFSSGFSASGAGSVRGFFAKSPLLIASGASGRA